MRATGSSVGNPPGPLRADHRRDEMRHHLALQLSRRASGDRGGEDQGAGVLLAGPGAPGEARPLRGPLGLRPRPPPLRDGGLDRLQQVGRARRGGAYPRLRPQAQARLRGARSLRPYRVALQLHVEEPGLDPRHHRRAPGADLELLSLRRRLLPGVRPREPDDPRLRGAELGPARHRQPGLRLPRPRPGRGDRRPLGPQRHRAAEVLSRAPAAPAGSSRSRPRRPGGAEAADPPRARRAPPRQGAPDPGAAPRDRRDPHPRHGPAPDRIRCRRRAMGFLTR